MSAIFRSSSSFVKMVAFSVLFITVFFLLKHLSVNFAATAPDRDFSLYSSAGSGPPPPPMVMFERTGIINDMGFMSDDFVVGEFDEGLIQSLVINGGHEKGRSDLREVIKLEKFRFCEDSMIEQIPCWDNVDAVVRINSNYSRHCPAGSSKRFNCLVPRPQGYKIHIPWPHSRNEVWFDNVPHTGLIEDKGGINQISRKDDKLIFQGAINLFIHDVNQYLDQISKMVPEIAFGRHTRVALDVGSGVASFGVYLMDRNVTTLSIDSNIHENPTQLALERGVPALVAGLGSRRMPIPSQAFDLIHCSSKINWTQNAGILLLEANRMLRAGGYFVWAAEPVFKSQDELAEQWKEMEELTVKICWKLVNKEGYIAIWQKPLNNSCYLSRDLDVHPMICGTDDDPDDIWDVKTKKCISRLPENGYGGNITEWAGRLHSPPDRLFSIEMDAYNSRRDIYRVDSKYQNDIVSGYISAFHLNDVSLRNVMDMKAGYGGFAAALLDLHVNCWVMNVVPVTSSNTLPVIYDRGLVGLMHDWCEPFDSYPRTYDLMNAAGLFSVEHRRCNITNIMLEMDRMLRPGGRAYIRDTTVVIYQLEEIAKAMGWVTFMFDSGDGPHSHWKLLHCEKRL